MPSRPCGGWAVAKRDGRVELTRLRIVFGGGLLLKGNQALALGRVRLRQSRKCRAKTNVRESDRSDVRFLWKGEKAPARVSRARGGGPWRSGICPCQGLVAGCWVAGPSGSGRRRGDRLRQILAPVFFGSAAAPPLLSTETWRVARNFWGEVHRRLTR